MNVIIVGSGIAGLAAGYELKKRGWEVVVLEQNAGIGGRTQTFRKNGYTLERGATQLTTGYTAYMELADDLGLGDSITKSEQSIMFVRKNKLRTINIENPLSALFSGVLSLRSWFKLLNVVWDYRQINPPINVLDVSASSEKVDIETAYEYSMRRLNTEIYDVLIDPMIRLYVLNNGKNVTVMEFFSAVKNLIGNRLCMMEGGIQRLPDELAKHVGVKTSASVESVRKMASGEGVEVEVTLPTGRELMTADACIVATQLHQAYDLVPEMKELTEPLNKALTYNRAVVVTLGYSVLINRKGLGVVLGCSEHPQIGLVWLEHKKAKDVAPSGHSLITFFFEETGLDDIVPDTDKAFIEIAEAWLFRYFPELNGRRDMDSVTRWKKAIPNPNVGSYKALKVFHEGIDHKSPIQFAGDYLTCTGQNSAAYWGQTAAARVDKYIGRRNSPDTL